MTMTPNPTPPNPTPPTDKVKMPAWEFALIVLLVALLIGAIGAMYLGHDANDDRWAHTVKPTHPFRPHPPLPSGVPEEAP
jgi:hypothetical protein